MISIATQKRDDIVAGDMKKLAKILEREQVCMKLAHNLRQQREQLVFAFAQNLELEPKQLRMAQILERAPEPLRSELQGKQSSLKEVLTHLRELNDRNMVLIRQSLGFVRDILSLIGNEHSARGYDNSGDSQRGQGGGGIVDSKA